MGRPKGSRNNYTADDEALRNSVDSDELRGFIEDIETTNTEIADLNEHRRGRYAAAKAAGYDTATIRAIIKCRAMDPEKRRAMDELLDEYMSALGDFATTPLGEAGADRMRDEVRV